MLKEREVEDSGFIMLELEIEGNVVVERPQGVIRELNTHPIYPVRLVHYEQDENKDGDLDTHRETTLAWRWIETRTQSGRPAILVQECNYMAICNGEVVDEDDYSRVLTYEEQEILLRQHGDYTMYLL